MRKYLEKLPSILIDCAIRVTRYIWGLFHHPIKNLLFWLEVCLTTYFYLNYDALKKYMVMFIGSVDNGGSLCADVPKMLVLAVGLVTLMTFISNSLFKDLSQRGSGSYFLGVNKESFHTYTDQVIKRFTESPIGLSLSAIAAIPILITLSDTAKSVDGFSLVHLGCAIWISAYFWVASLFVTVAIRCLVLDINKFSDLFIMDSNKDEWIKYMIREYVSRRYENLFQRIFNNGSFIRYLKQAKLNSNVFNNLIDVIQARCADETERKIYFDAVFGSHKGVSKAISEAISNLRNGLRGDGTEEKIIGDSKIQEQELSTLEHIYTNKWRAIYTTTCKNKSVIPPDSIVNMGLIDLQELHHLEEKFVTGDHSSLKAFRDIFWSNSIRHISTCLTVCSFDQKHRNVPISYITDVLQGGFREYGWLESLRADDPEISDSPTNRGTLILLCETLKEIDETQRNMGEGYDDPDERSATATGIAESISPLTRTGKESCFFSKVFIPIFTQAIDQTELENSRRFLAELSQPYNELYKDARNASKAILFDPNGIYKKGDSLKALLSFLSLADIISALIITLFWRKRTHEISSTMSCDEFEIWQVAIRRASRTDGLDFLSLTDDQKNKIIEELEGNRVKAGIDYFASKSLVWHLGEVISSTLDSKRYCKFKALDGDAHFSLRAYLILYLLLGKDCALLLDPKIIIANSLRPDLSSNDIEKIKKELELPPETDFLDKQRVCDCDRKRRSVSVHHSD